MTDTLPALCLLSIQVAAPFYLSTGRPFALSLSFI